jgi:hypothetical protein
MSRLLGVFLLDSDATVFSYGRLLQRPFFLTSKVEQN